MKEEFKKDDKELLEHNKNLEALLSDLFDADFISSYYELEEEFNKFTKRHNVNIRLIDWLNSQS